MRILWVNHRCPKHPSSGGAEVQIRELGKRLVKLGHEITLVSEKVDGLKDFDIIDGIKVIRIGNMYSIHLFAPLLVKKIENNFDIIIDDIAHAVPWWSPIIAKKPVIGIIHHVHQDVIDIELSFPKNIAVKFAEKTIKFTYKNLITVSKFTKKQLVKKFKFPPDRVHVVYNGVDHEIYKPNQEKFKEPTVLWVGRIKKYKNLNHLIKAFSKVKKKINNARLIIAGNGNYENYFKTSNLNIDGVKFLGKVSEKTKILFLQRSWVLGVTSKIEGWGMNIIEAAACGTPTVGYKVGALEEAVINGKTGFLVEYGNIQALANKICELLLNKELREKLSINALKWAKNFDWDKSSKKFEKILKQTISHHF